jgi:hypothetical protein
LCMHSHHVGITHVVEFGVHGPDPLEAVGPKNLQPGFFLGRPTAVLHKTYIFVLVYKQAFMNV